MLFLTI